MRSRELRSHLGLFCSTSATVQELVSCAEAYRASRTEVNLISDEEGEAPAVTIAYTRNSRPGATFKQWTKPAADKEHEASKGTEDGQGSSVGVRKSKFPGYRQRVNTSQCSGKCCFHCGKEGHFARNCAAKGACHYVSEETLACEDKDHEKCECECGQHRHFLSAGDRDKVRLVITVPKPAT